jgi:N4-gp56 family major capsid protein
VKSAGKMTEQRIPWSIREEAMMGLSDWWANRMDTAFFNQMCSYTPANDPRFTGMNAVAPVSAGHQFWPNAKANDQSLAAGDEMTLGLIDQMVAMAKLMTPVIRPIKINGDDRYVMVIHTNQVTELRTNTATGQWLDIQKAIVSGGDITNNPIMTGALGMYNGVVLHESTRITPGVNSSTGVTVPHTRRAVLLGAQAGAIAFGRGQSWDSFDWNEELFDYGNKLGVEAGLIHGLKKLRFNNADFSTIVLSTYTP